MRPRLSTSALALAAALVAATTACIPVNQIEPASPNIYGTFRDDSGAAIVGVPIAITDESWRDPCGHTVYHAVTDSAGVFHLDATTRVQKWLVLIPPVERFVNLYGVCVPSRTGDGATRVAYRGTVPLRWRTAPRVDTLACLRFVVRGAQRAVCGTPHDDRVQTGGRWSAGGTAGSYRLIADHAGRASGVFLQWLDRAGRPVATVDFPFPRGKHPEVDRAQLFSDATPTCVRVRTRNDPPHWYTSTPAALDSTFELGAPGVMRAVRGCGAPSGGGASSPRSEAPTMNPSDSLPIDHVILGIDSLDRGISLVEQATGVRPVFGGAHPGRGTRNALLSLGDGRYLELIAPNPSDTTARARQAPSIYARDFAGDRAPTPYGWAIHVPDADAERARLVGRGLSAGEVAPGSRARPDGSVLHWKTLDPWGPAAASHGDVLPFVIAWGAGSAHPAMTTPAGCTLAALTIVSPHPDSVRALFDRAGWPVALRAGAREHLEVVLDCPKGRVHFP